jgi:ABC-type phosphate transport system substrate-binding protein
MNRHHTRRRLATLAACVGTTAALAALGSAGTALATVTCRAPGFASGSSFQKTALLSVYLTSPGWGSHSNCSTAPTSSTITYTATSSGAGLEEFGNTAGHFVPSKDPTAHTAELEEKGTKDVAGNVLDWFVGTDDAPTPRELGEAALAAGTLHNQKAEITIPIAQAPVAVMLSLPADCKLQAGSSIDLNNTTIPQLWESTTVASGEDPGGIQAQGGFAINTWGALFTQLGYSKITSGTPGSGQFLDEGGEHGCGQEITPQVRSTSSGTSFAFKSYLSQVNPAVWTGFTGDAPTWPHSGVVESDLKTGSLTESLSNETGGNLVKNTAANPGSVGYANTADAATAGNGGFTNAATVSTFSSGTGSSPSHQILWAEIQNNGTETEGATYEDPLEPASSIGNCETTKILPAEEGFPYSYTDSWYGLLASDPNIAADAAPTDYPICALTYDLVFHHYSNKHLFGATETAHEVANTVHDLFEYITTQGQVEIQSHDFTRYPTGFQSHINNAVNPGIGY